MVNVELYLFERGAETRAVTPHEYAVDYAHDSRRYTSLPLSRSALNLGAEDARAAALDLDLPPDSELAAWLMQGALEGVMTTLSVYQVTHGDPIWDSYAGQWLPNYQHAVLWLGRVLGIDAGDAGARAHCESASVSLKRVGLRKLYSRRCTHVLYAPACGAAVLSAASQVVGVDGLNVEMSIPPAVDGHLAGGWLQEPSGRRLMIVEQISAGIVGVRVLTPPRLAVGDPVTLVAGCDHLSATCAARFNNLDNFGGFPFIPAKNPFSTGVF